jgi:sirohydrochlorin ferrochelatase
MKSLLIIAHGSRRQASNDEVEALAARLRRLPQLEFDDVSVAFLELATPGISEALEHCVERGFLDITVFPYFLAAGRHVVADIPVELEKFQAEYPQVSIALTPHLGAAASLPGTILEMVAGDQPVPVVSTGTQA